MSRTFLLSLVCAFLGFSLACSDDDGIGVPGEGDPSEETTEHPETTTDPPMGSPTEMGDGGSQGDEEREDEDEDGEDEPETVASPGTVTLVLEVADGASYCGQEGGCRPRSSIRIENTEGETLTRWPGLCFTACSTCEQTPCGDVYCPTQGYELVGETLEWDGAFWLGDTCDEDSSCRWGTFAPPGDYVAVMCGTPGALEEGENGFDQCMATDPDECVEVPFEFPSDEIYTGRIGEE